jgi:hypothetical protein
MRSQPARTSAAVLVLIGLGMSALLVGFRGGQIGGIPSTLPANGLTNYGGAGRSPDTCKEFIETKDPADLTKFMYWDRNADLVDKENISVRAYRNRTLWTIANPDFNVGQWIGWAKNKEPSKKSKAYPGLSEGQDICFKFTAHAHDNGDLYYIGDVFRRNGGASTARLAYLCRVTTQHDQESTPSWYPIFPDCPEMQVTAFLGMQSGKPDVIAFTWRATAGQDTSTYASSVAKVLRDSLTARSKKLAVKPTISPALIELFMAAATQSGAWFPCAQYGCCRVIS